jgi:hypothetical protein
MLKLRSPNLRYERSALRYKLGRWLKLFAKFTEHGIMILAAAWQLWHSFAALNVHWQLAATTQERLCGFNVQIKLALIVSRPTAIEAVVADGGLKWRGSPLLDWSCRLHVVVPVGQQRGPAIANPLSVNDGMPARREHLYSGQAGRAEPACKPLRTSLYIGFASRVGTETPNRNEFPNLYNITVVILRQD